MRQGNGLLPEISCAPPELRLRRRRFKRGRLEQQHARSAGAYMTPAARVLSASAVTAACPTDAQASNRRLQRDLAPPKTYQSSSRPDILSLHDVSRRPVLRRFHAQPVRPTQGGGDACYAPGAHECEKRHVPGRRCGAGDQCEADGCCPTGATCVECDQARQAARPCQCVPATEVCNGKDDAATASSTTSRSQTKMRRASRHRGPSATRQL